MKKVIFVAILLNFARFGSPVLKTWRHDNDILNPEHWTRNEALKECEGFDMRDVTHGVLVVDELKAKRVLLPRDASLYFPEGTHIELDENDGGELNCVRLKNDFLPYDWVDPASWTSDETGHNPAVPHTERIPCEHDSVAFPKGWKSSQCEMDLYENQNFKVRSFKFGQGYLSNYDLPGFSESIPILPSYIQFLLEIMDEPCDDRTGCLCGRFSQGGICNNVQQPQRYECLDPIIPVGFCTKLCGASILINTTSDNFKANFNIAGVRKALKAYSSYTHVSKVVNHYQTQIQIVFAEEKFKEVSVNEARQFYSRLLTDSWLGASEAILITSGIQLIENETGKAALSIIFGTLCGVLLVFGIIFFVNSPRFDRLNLRGRSHFSIGPLAGLFARYEKMEGLDRAESVISLQKSFDNPMYGTSAPSTASTSGAITEPVAKSETRLENPLYEIHNLNEPIEEENVDGGQLVDISEKTKIN